jgi:hypothetical protein
MYLSRRGPRLLVRTRRKVDRVEFETSKRIGGEGDLEWFA